MAATNLAEKLQEAIQACEEISARDLNAQKAEIAKLFGELQQAVYEVIDEKGIILANCEWKTEITTVNSARFGEVLDAEAERISAHTGYSKKTVRELLSIENCFKASSSIGLFTTTYTYRTIKI